MGIGIIIGGISLYRSYAIYEEEKEYNVLKGQIPDFGYDVKFAFTVEGNKAEKLPTDKNYVVDITCDNDIKAEWDYETWSPIVPNVVNTTKCNINYVSPNNINTLAEKLGVSFNDISGIITNIDKLVSSKEGMIYLTKSPELINQLKASNNYNDEIKEKILNSAVITEKEKYEAGLPCYLLKNYKEEDFFDEFKIFNVNSGDLPNVKVANGVSNYKKQFLASVSNTSINIGSETKIDLANYSKVKIEFNHYTDYSDNSLTGTFDLGIGNDIWKNWSDVSYCQTKTFNNGNNSSQSGSLTLDVSSYNDSYYIKAKLHHGTEVENNSVVVEVKNIALY